MAEASILVTLRDQYSAGINTMRSANENFGRSTDRVSSQIRSYQTRLNALVEQQGRLSTELVDARKELKEAEKAYRDTGEAADAETLNRARQKYEALKVVMSETTQASKATQNALRELDNQQRRGSSGSSGSSTLAALGKAGLGQMAGDAAQAVANTLIGSTFGDTAGSVLSSGLSGAISGAAIGSLAGPVGTAIGAAIGGGLGLITGGAQAFQTKDEAFKSYVQEAAEGQFSAQEEAVASGSSIAAGREQKQMAFTTLLGSEEAAAAFLADVQEMAAMTNYTYDEITGYAKSLVKPFGADKSLGILTTLSDASAALSLNESDNAVLIAGLTRMKLTDKTTQEYLNYFSERGIDVYEALSKWGDAATVAEKVTRGEIGRAHV